MNIIEPPSGFLLYIVILFNCLIVKSLKSMVLKGLSNNELTISLPVETAADLKRDLITVRLF